MWKEIVINNHNYFYMCNLVPEKNEVYYVLCDLKVVWIEKITLDELQARLKVYNKRIEYNKETLLESINNHIPEDVSFEENSDNDVRILNMKYYVANRPLLYSWKLNQCDSNEFKNIITHPLLLALCYLTKQNENLLEIIRKKDIEIDQYKIEGAKLKRSKIATKPFDFNNFQASCPKILSFDNIYKFVNQNIYKLKSSCTEFIEESKNVTVIVGKSNNETTISQKSPIKSKKRRFLENQQNLLEKRLKIRETKIDYEDSDSPPIFESKITKIHNERNYDDLAFPLADDSSNKIQTTKDTPSKINNSVSPIDHILNDLEEKDPSSSINENNSFISPSVRFEENLYVSPTTQEDNFQLFTQTPTQKTFEISENEPKNNELLADEKKKAIMEVKKSIEDLKRLIAENIPSRHST